MHLLEFAKAVYSIGFKEKPSYGKLKFLLLKSLMNDDIEPSKVLDWMRLPRLNVNIKPTRKQQILEDLESMDVDEHVTFKLRES